MLSLGEWITGDVREIKDPEYATAPVVGYVVYGKKSIISIPSLQRTPAKVCSTDAEAMEWLESVHRRRQDKHADWI